MSDPGWAPRGDHTPLSGMHDALLLPTVFIVNCFLFSSWRQLAHLSSEPWLVLVWLYGLVMLVPLFWRHRAPVTVFASQCVLTAAAWPIMPQYTPFVGVPIALYSVAVHDTRRVALLALLASFVPEGMAAVVAFRVWPDPTDQLASFTANAVFLGVLTGAAWGAGRLTRAGLLRLRALEKERRTAREAVVAERGRIARELHDIISHAVTVMVLQATGAGRVAHTNVDQVTRSLAHIETTGRQAVTELRRLLGVLNTGCPDRHAADSGNLGPQAGLADLPALLSSLRATGMSITDQVEGLPFDLNPSVDLAAYRIAQEGLTNVLKHAGKDAHSQLRLTWETSGLHIQIDNDTNPAAAHRDQALSSGQGLLGLRERVHAVGGHLVAGSHGQRYRLTATLPSPDTMQPHTLQRSPLNRLPARPVADQWKALA